MSQDSTLANYVRTQRIVWFAIFASVGVIFAVQTILPPPSAEPNERSFFVMAAVALANAIVSFTLPRVSYRQQLDRVKVRIQEVADPNEPAGFGAAKRVRVFQDPDKARRAARHVFTPSYILSLGFSESVAMFGLVLRTMGHETLMTLPFYFVSVVLIAIRFPKEGEAERRFAEALNARFP